MNSRQRVHAAINYRSPDRPPIDVNVTLAFFEKLAAHLDVDYDQQPVPSLAMEVILPIELLNELGVDIITVKFPAGTGDSNLPRHKRDAWGIEYQLVEQMAGAYYEAVTHPLAKATVDDLLTYPWPDLPSSASADVLRDQARRLYEETDLALMGRFGAPIMETAALLLGMEEWYLRLGTDPDFIHMLLDKISHIAIQTDLLGIEAAGQYLQIVKVSGEDFGAQNGLLYSPAMFRDLLLPPLTRRWRTVREKLDEVKSEAKIMLHSCGAVRALIPDLISAGIEILDPIQPLAEGMDPELLHADFGGRLVFHGGIDVQRLLPAGTTEEVIAETRRYIKTLHAANGGYLVAPSHTVQADVPPENLLAMISAVREAEATLNTKKN